MVYHLQKNRINISLNVLRLVSRSVKFVSERDSPQVTQENLEMSDVTRMSVCFLTGRIYKCLFTGSVSSLLTLPLDMLST